MLLEDRNKSVENCCVCKVCAANVLQRLKTIQNDDCKRDDEREEKRMAGKNGSEVDKGRDGCG